MNEGKRARRWIVALATSVGVAATAALGVWQLGRAAQKEALQAALDERSQLPALQTQQLAQTPGEGALQHYRSARVSGHWLAERTVFLENRQMNGRPGFFVVTPLELRPGDAVLVQRGWAPRDMRDRTLVPAVPTPAGLIVIEGRIAPPPAKLYDFASEEGGPIRQNLDPEVFAREIGVVLRPVSLMQVVSPSPDDGLLRQWSRPAVDVHKHYGYAFQWFALCALMAGLYVWFRILRPRRFPSAEPQ
jgi:surfeit locus 1 family protein